MHKLPNFLLFFPIFRLSSPNFFRFYPTRFTNFVEHFSCSHGYPQHFVDNVIRKHPMKTKKHCLSTLFQQNKQLDRKDERIRVSMSYAPVITNSLKHAFHQNNMQIVYKSDSKLKNKLGQKTKPIHSKNLAFILSSAVCTKKVITGKQKELH